MKSFDLNKFSLNQLDSSELINIEGGGILSTINAFSNILITVFWNDPINHVVNNFGKGYANNIN